MANKKIMIVDDDKEFLEELNETLCHCGYDIISASDPELALIIAAKDHPDLVIVDLKMPKKTGFQLADEMRYLAGLDNTPIIAMTGFFKESYGPLLNICRIKKCLRKPFNPLDIIAEIEDLLSEKNEASKLERDR